MSNKFLKFVDTNSTLIESNNASVRTNVGHLDVVSHELHPTMCELE